MLLLRTSVLEKETGHGGNLATGYPQRSTFRYVTQLSWSFSALDCALVNALEVHLLGLHKGLLGQLEPSLRATVVVRYVS